jgi:hypothetical protein
MRIARYVEGIMTTITPDATLLTDPPYVDLRSSPYNVIANDSTPAVATANTVGINLAITTHSGTPACLMLPMGDIYLEQAPGARNWSILFGTGVSDVTLAGQGMFATRLIQNGVGDLGEWDGLVVNGAQRIEVRDLAILQGTIDHPDPVQQNHLVAVYNTVPGGTTRDIYVHDVWFGKTIGDAFRVSGRGGGPEVCENVRLLNFQMELNGIVNVPSGRRGARSGISIQRGYQNLEFGGAFIRGAQNSLIDMEPTGTGTMHGAYFHDLDCDNSQGHTGSAVSFGGVSHGARAAALRVRDVTVREGRIIVISTERAEFDRVTITSASAFASDPHIASLVVRQVNNDLQLRHLSIERIGASAAGPCLDIENAGNATTILSPTIRQGTNQLPIRLDGCTRPRISGAHIRFDGTSPGNWDAVFVAATVANANHPQIDDVHLISSTGKMRSAVGLYVRTARTMEHIRVTDVNCAGSALQAVLLSADPGSGVDSNPIIQAIDNDTDPLWRSDDHNANGIFPITQGSSAGETERCLEGRVTPNGNVVGNIGDIYRWRPTATTAEIWFKATQGVAGVPDNAGWVLK